MTSIDVIRELCASDAEAFAKLRREALLDSPLAFASSPDDDIAGSVEKARDLLRDARKSVVLGAFRPALVGLAGLYIDRHVKASHKAHLWGLYVAPAHRRKGIAARLLDAILRHAATLPGVERVQLSVTSATSGARQLYERTGFRVWGSEPDALRHDGQTVVEHYMALRISPDLPSTNN